MLKISWATGATYDSVTELNGRDNDKTTVYSFLVREAFHLSLTGTANHL